MQSPIQELKHKMQEIRKRIDNAGILSFKDAKRLQKLMEEAKSSK